MPNRNQFFFGLFIASCGFVIFNYFGISITGYRSTGTLFTWWAGNWFDPNSDTSHGPIILLLAVWLLFRNVKSSTIQHPIPEYRIGLSVIALALLLNLVGYYAQHPRISVLGFLIFLVGSAFLLGGRRWGKAIIFPCLFLLFSVRWTVITDEFGFPMRLGVIKLSYSLSQSIGIDVIRNGTQLFSPDGSYQYDVAPACSGIRSLIALSSLSLILGYVSFRSWWRRSLLFLLAFPFAFIGNVIRIFSIILVAEWLGQKAGSIVHEWFGFLIFLIVLGFAMLTARLLQRFIPEQDLVEPKTQNGSSVDPAIARPGLKLTISMGGAILALSSMAAWLTHRVDQITPVSQCGVVLAENQIDPKPLPSLLSFDWAGQNVEVSKEERELLPDDTGFARRNYVNLLNPGKRVFVSIVLSGADRSSIHRPEVCLVAQGWTVNGKFQHDFDIPAIDGGRLPVTILRIERYDRNAKQVGGKASGLYAYWFVGGEVVVPSHTERFVRTALDRFLKLKTHRWAYVVAQTLTPDGEESGLARIEEVIRQVLPEFQKVGFDKT